MIRVKVEYDKIEVGNEVEAQAANEDEIGSETDVEIWVQNEIRFLEKAEAVGIVVEVVTVAEADLGDGLDIYDRN